MLLGGGAMVASGGTAAIAEVLQDPLSLLAGRSPGSRPEGALFASKREKQAAGPVELVLSEERERPGGAGPVGAGDPVIDPLVAPIEQVLPAAAPADVAGTAIPLPFPILGGSPGGGIYIPIGGGPSGGPGGGGPAPSPTPSSTPSPTPTPTASPTPDPTPSPSPTPSPKPTPTPTWTPTPTPSWTPVPGPDPDPEVPPAVPEPATWLMMILGFYLVGASLRSKAKQGAAHGAT